MRKEVPQQIADVAIKRIHTLTNSPGCLTLGGLHGREKQKPPYVGQLEILFAAEPQLFAQKVDQYVALTKKYNQLVQSNSPHLALFPQLEETQNVLNQFANRNTLPSLEELQNLPNWEQILHNGVEKAAGLIEVGNYISSKKDNKIVQRIQKWFKVEQIIAPSRSDLETPVVNTAIVGHIMERIYLAWLEEVGYKGKKEDIMKIFDAMVMYERLTEKAIPPKPSLDAEFAQLGWVRDEQFNEVKKGFKNALLAERQKGKVYFTSSDERNLKQIDPQESLESEKQKRGSFQLFLPVGIISQNGFTFCLYRCDSWRQEKQSFGTPYYILETLFSESKEKDIEVIGHPITGERLPNDNTMNFILPPGERDEGWQLLDGIGAYRGEVSSQFKSAGIAMEPLMNSIHEIIKQDNH